MVRANIKAVTRNWVIQFHSIFFFFTKKHVTVHHCWPTSAKKACKGYFIVLLLHVF